MLPLVLGAALACCATAAEAAPADFHIRRKPLAEALLDFAVQADVSINAAAARQCRRLGNPVSGRMEAREALRRLLDETGCGFEMVGPRAFRIVPAQLPRVRPAPVSPRPAPPAVPDTPTTVDEVVVTATRRPSLASRLPYAVSAVGDERLEREGVDGAEDLAELTPGLTVTNLGPGRDKLIIRGLSDGPLTGRTQSTVGVYLDDLRVTYNAPDPDLALVDMERVEVLRGPQGSLYGAGSIGGVYHMVARKPQLEEAEGSLAAETRFTRDGEPGWALEAVYNMPLLGDRAALRVAGWDERFGGYVDNPQLGLEDVNRTSRRGLRATVLAHVGRDWTVTAGGLVQAINSADAQYVDGRDGSDLERSARLREPHHNDIGAGWVTLAGDSELGRLRWTTGYVRHELETRYDASAALPWFGAPLGPAAAYDESVLSETLVTELNLASPFGTRIPWLLGLFYAEGHEDIDARLYAPGPLYVEARAGEVSELAVYGEVSGSWGPWTATLGGRLFWVKDETRSRVDSGGATARFDGLLEENGFAPKVVLRYAPTSRLSIYAQAAEGYRTGGFNTGGLAGQVFNGTGGDQPWRRYPGDELWSHELGAKWTDARRRVNVQAALFHVDWEDIQSTQLLPSGLPFTASVGAGTSFGLELEAAWWIGPVAFNGNLILNEPELEEPGRGYPAVAESDLPGVSRFAAALSAHYERPLSGGWRVETDVRAAYVGESRLAFDPTTRPVMGDYGTLRLAVAVDNGEWRLGAFVENAGDTRGDTFAYGNPFTVRFQDQSTPLRPVTAGLRLEWSF